jgi:hypothetical protein
VKPIPLPLIQHAVSADHQVDAFIQALMDLTIIGFFFFLLRPGEHCYDKDNNHNFHLQDISFQSVNGTTNAATINESELTTATLVHLEFTNQKNGDKDEAISHGSFYLASLFPRTFILPWTVISVVTCTWMVLNTSLNRSK